MESKPEQYLRQIRDLESKNRILLEQLVEYKTHDEKRRKWRIMGRIALVLMPYILTIALAAFFYLKIVQSLDSFQASLSGLLPDFSGWQEKGRSLLDTFLGE